MGQKRWLTFVVAFVGAVVLGFVLTAVSRRLGKMGYEPFAGFWERREPTPAFEILPVAEDEPACALTEWEVVARDRERLLSVEILEMRVLEDGTGRVTVALTAEHAAEEGGAQFAVFMMADTMYWWSEKQVTDIVVIAVSWTDDPGCYEQIARLEWRLGEDGELELWKIAPLEGCLPAEVIQW